MANLCRTTGPLAVGKSHGHLPGQPVPTGLVYGCQKTGGGVRNHLPASLFLSSPARRRIIDLRQALVCPSNEGRIDGHFRLEFAYLKLCDCQCFDRCNPANGAFTQTDPKTSITQPGQFNPYTYAGADPANNTDPTGSSFFSSVFLPNRLDTLTGGKRWSAERSQITAVESARVV